MKTNIERPFYAAEIEIIKIDMCDIIVTSPTGPDPFEGEEDTFPTSWRDISNE
ncbi:MAG: hypothetical protein IJY79_04025 [Clostridia bacterium]|nr:hypothetical protein [Clostridia bacterium]